MFNKKILIITEYIAPVQAVAAIRWTKYAKFLAKDYGYSISVLTNQKDFDGSVRGMRPYRYDESLEKDLQWFDTKYIPSSLGQLCFNMLFSFGFHALNGIRGSAAKKQDINLNSGKVVEERLSQALFRKNIPEKVYEFVERQCGLALVRAGAHADVPWEEYDVIISSYGPLWPHLLARKIKKAHPNLFWIADFRDAIVCSERSDTRANRRLSRWVTDGADAVFGVSCGVQKRLNLSDEQKFHCVSNGFDMDYAPASAEHRPKKFRLSYTGTLYADGDCQSDLRPLFRALEELIASKEIASEDIELCYAGASSHLFRGMADAYQTVPAVDRGLLKRSEALKLQTDSVALILALWNTRIMRSGRTAKFYEYMSRGLPIIALVSGDVPHSEMCDLIQDFQLGFCYEEADQTSFESLKAYVLQLYSIWKNDELEKARLNPSTGASQFYYGTLAGELDAYISGKMQAFRE